MNGWAMLVGGALLLAVSAPTEDWGATTGRRRRSARSSISPCSAPASRSSTLTVLLRELPSVTVSFISMIIPFGALALGALLRDER